MREGLHLYDDDTVEIPGNSHVMYPNKHKRQTEFFLCLKQFG